MLNEKYFLYKITPKPDLSFRQILNIGNLDPYGQHKTLWKLFDLPKQEKKEKTDFLFRYEMDKKNKLPLFYVLSCKQAPCDKEGIWEIESKQYDPDIRENDRLFFHVRVNPVITKKPVEPDINPNKRKRHDIVMEAKKHLRNEDTTKKSWPHINEIIHKAGMNWLKMRAEKNGFIFSEEDTNSDIRVEGYQTHQFIRKGKKTNFSSLDFNGTLSVVNPELFKNILFNGLGPAKSFGCGLMLVRRV
jgi:CRISPR system Cascade subunit CasE